MAEEAVALTREDRERQAGLPPRRDDLCYAAGLLGDTRLSVQTAVRGFSSSQALRWKGGTLTQQAERAL